MPKDEDLLRIMNSSHGKEYIKLRDQTTKQYNDALDEYLTTYLVTERAHLRRSHIEDIVTNTLCQKNHEVTGILEDLNDDLNENKQRHSTLTKLPGYMLDSGIVGIISGLSFGAVGAIFGEPYAAIPAIIAGASAWAVVEYNNNTKQEMMHEYHLIEDCRAKLIDTAVKQSMEKFQKKYCLNFRLKKHQISTVQTYDLDKCNMIDIFYGNNPQSENVIDYDLPPKSKPQNRNVIHIDFSKIRTKKTP